MVFACCSDVAPNGARRMSRFGILLVTVFAMVCAGFLSVPVNAVEDEVGYMGFSNGYTSHAEQKSYCEEKGFTMAMVVSASVQEAIADITKNIPTASFFAYLGGSLTKSTGCPDPSSTTFSLSCVWSWEEGPYANEGLPFYRGNYHPPAAGSPGLNGAGTLNGFPEYWGKKGTIPAFPGEKFGRYIMMAIFTSSDNYAISGWADNEELGGFQYMDGTLNNGEYYTLCRSGAFPSTTTPQPTTKPPVTPSPEASSSSGGTNTGSSSTEPPEDSTKNPKPTPTPCVGADCNNTNNDSSGVNIGVWIGIAVGAVVIVVLCVLGCCFRKRLVALCCAPKGDGQTVAAQTSWETVSAENRSFDQSLHATGDAGGDVNKGLVPKRRHPSRPSSRHSGGKLSDSDSSRDVDEVESQKDHSGPLYGVQVPTTELPPEYLPPENNLSLGARGHSFRSSRKVSFVMYDE